MARKLVHLSMLFSALGCLAVFVAGCQKDDIQLYVAPKPVEVKPAAPEGDGPPERMLGAVIPHDDDYWFLKLKGPEALVAKHKADFDQVLRSFRFLDQQDKPVAWTTPTGWSTQPETENRYATLTCDTLELTITVLRPRPDPMMSAVVSNINRWRRQLGLNPIIGTELPQVSTNVKLESGTAVAVDFMGIAQKSAGMPGAPFHKGGPPKAQAARPPAPPAAPFEYTVPNGWTAMPDKGGPIRPAAAFEVVEGNQQATVTVTRLSGGSGSVAMNIDRWRGQVGLKPATPEELKNVGEITVGGIKSPYVDLSGPKTDRDQLRMLAAIVTQGDTTWYFKFFGSAELINRQKATFEAFMSSVRFQGGSRG
jgi:hypothetical protein